MTRISLRNHRNSRIFFQSNEINSEIWAFLERYTKRNLVLFKRNTGQGQVLAATEQVHEADIERKKEVENARDGDDDEDDDTDEDQVSL